MPDNFLDAKVEEALSDIGVIDGAIDEAAEYGQTVETAAIESIPKSKSSGRRRKGIRTRGSVPIVYGPDESPKPSFSLSKITQNSHVVLVKSFVV